MLILLPPSEGKATPPAGGPVDLEALSFPTLTPARRTMVDALARLSLGRPGRARATLGLSVRQDDELARNRDLLHAAAAPAAEVYSGVLYDALAYQALPAVARRRLDEWVVISSALWGAVRLTDAIPPYRLSGDVTLPRVGKVSGFWRDPLGEVMPTAAEGQIVLDLRSATYARLWSPREAVAERTVVGRVLQRRPDGSVTVVSHHNKATKGRLVASLTRRSTPRTLRQLAENLARSGLEVDLVAPARGLPGRIDLVVNDL